VKQVKASNGLTSSKAETQRSAVGISAATLENMQQGAFCNTN